MGCPPMVCVYTLNIRTVAQLGDFRHTCCAPRLCLRHRLIILLRGGADGFQCMAIFIAGLRLLGAGLGDGVCAAMLCTPLVNHVVDQA